ncbi:hypothetical protein AOLI_G00314750 [Acnodon oligacanthus]
MGGKEEEEEEEEEAGDRESEKKGEEEGKKKEEKGRLSDCFQMLLHYRKRENKWSRHIKRCWRWRNQSRGGEGVEAGPSQMACPNPEVALRGSVFGGSPPQRASGRPPGSQRSAMGELARFPTAKATTLVEPVPKTRESGCSGL